MTKVQIYGWAFFTIGYLWGAFGVRHVNLVVGLAVPLLIGVALVIFEPKVKAYD